MTLQPLITEVPAYEGTTYDVVIMGGGPAGATLAALLGRQTKLKIALFEKDFFPREHIGESFSHRVTTVLEESGALAKVLASDCWVKKYGGYYAWDPAAPSVALFDPLSSERDGALRWSIHVNRSEFDQILLEHARSCGVAVFEGVSISKVTRDADGITSIDLGADGKTRGRYFVEASGRQTAVATGQTKAYLSDYKNIAIWNHVVGGKPAQSLPGDWNVFREKDLSPIGNFAFEDGWFWYIPVRKMIMGKRVLTHSLGMVTDPRILKDPAKRYTDAQVLLKKAKEVHLLKDLLVDAEQVSDKVLTATNYSMISERFCNFDERWMLIGDAAYFVDPLFSSGAAFAMMHAASAANVIKWTFEGSQTETLQREMWDDYDHGWQTIARSFALSIDQWYHAIAVNNRTSVYWQNRARSQIFDVSQRPFQALVDTGIAPDLLRVLTKGSTNLEDLGSSGPLVEALASIKDKGPSANARLALKSNVALKASLTVDPGRGKAVQNPNASVPLDPAATRYWSDPVRYAGDVACLYPEPRKCHRFYTPSVVDGPQVRFDDSIHGGVALFELLAAKPHARSELDQLLSAGQQALLARLVTAGMVDIS